MSTPLEPSMRDNFFRAPGLGIEPVTHADGLLSICQVWEDRLDLTVVPDLPSLTRHAVLPGARSQVQVIVDGSAAMDRHWSKDQILESSRIAAAVYQIASHIDPDREELVVGFLSSDHFEEVSLHRGVLEIEAALNRVREQAGLRQRGAFLRPLREQSLRIYGTRRKRILLFSDTDVPDWEDVEDCLVDSCERIRLQAAASVRHEPALFAADQTLNTELLDRYFHRLAVTVPKLCVAVGSDFPLEIEPLDGVVSQRDDGYWVSWSKSGALDWQIKLRLNGLAPSQVKVSADLLRSGELREITFAAPATRARLEPIGQETHGVLGESDAALWQLLCTPGKACPECGRQNVHVYHDYPTPRLERQLVFSLLENAERWLLLAAADSKWTMFRTGCRAAGVSLVLVDGVLYRSATERRLERVPPDCQEEGLYCLEHEGRTMYVAAPEWQETWHR